jgi:hypothetical protein
MIVLRGSITNNVMEFFLLRMKFIIMFIFMETNSKNDGNKFKNCRIALQNYKKPI